jgi:RimJ/RimL family protein N-acetyltransferase
MRVPSTSSAARIVIETPRLLLRHMTIEDDTALIRQLLNDPAFIQNIGDRGVRTDDDARRYIDDGPRASYQRFGFGLYAVTTKATGESIGICGLVKREFLDDADVGYALLPGFRGMGYATEAASAVLRYGLDTLRLPRIVALTHPDNEGSIRVLEKLGLRSRGRLMISGDTRVTLLFGAPASADPARLPGP